MTILYPSGWRTKSKVSASKRTQVQAGLDMSAEVAGAGLCPITKEPMTQMYVNGHLANVHLRSRIVLPIKD